MLQGFSHSTSSWKTVFGGKNDKAGRLLFCQSPQEVRLMNQCDCLQNEGFRIPIAKRGGSGSRFDATWIYSRNRETSFRS